MSLKVRWREARANVEAQRDTRVRLGIGVCSGADRAAAPRCSHCTWVHTGVGLTRDPARGESALKQPALEQTVPDRLLSDKLPSNIGRIRGRRKPGVAIGRDGVRQTSKDRGSRTVIFDCPRSNDARSPAVPRIWPSLAVLGTSSVSMSSAPLATVAEEAGGPEASRPRGFEAPRLQGPAALKPRGFEVPRPRSDPTKKTTGAREGSRRD